MILHETIANFIEEVKLINWFEESGIPNELDFRYVCGKIRKDECPDVITFKWLLKNIYREQMC